MSLTELEERIKKEFVTLIELGYQNYTDKVWSQEHLGESGGSEIHQALHRVPEGSTRYSSTAEEPPQAIGWNHLSDVFNHEKHHVRAI